MKWRNKKVKEMGRGEVSGGHGVSSSVDFSDFMTRFIQICLWVEKLFPKSCQKQFIELDTILGTGMAINKRSSPTSGRPP